MSDVKVQSFRDRTFLVRKGQTHPEFSFFTFEEEERDIREKYWNVQEGDVVVDVGASYGSYTLAACAMGAKKVFAYEPEPTVWVDLVRNLDLNRWHEADPELSRCVPFCMGLWSVEGVVSMKSYAPHWPSHTISGDYAVTTLDRLSASDRFPDRLDWIKVDVEGAEEHVLKGAKFTIAKFHPKLLVECHTFLDPEMVNKVKDILKWAIRSPWGPYNFEEIDRPPCVMLVAR